MKCIPLILFLFPFICIGQTVPVVYSQGEYQNLFVGSDSLGYTISNAPGLWGTNNVGTYSKPNRIGTATKMSQPVNSLHNWAFLDINDTAWFGGQQCGNPYITGTGTYKANLDSSGNPIAFLQMAAGWNNQDGEFCWYVGIKKSDSSLWICGDLQNGIRGNGTNGLNNQSWVKVTLPAGKKAKQVECGSQSCIVLFWDGTVATWGVSGCYQSNLGYGTPTFGQSTASYGNTYKIPTLISASHIRMIAGGMNSNWLIDSSGNVLGYGIYGWQMGHTTSVGSDALNTPTNLTSILNLPTPIDTVVTDAACTHFLVGTGRIFGIGSNEQGTVGNGYQLNYATYSPPYDNGGANEGTGGLVQFTAVEICPGKTNFTQLYNGGFYNYWDMAKDANGDFYCWGRNKGGVLPVGTQPYDTLASNIQSVQPQGWQRSFPTKLKNPFAIATVALSTSQGCFNACTAGPVTGSPCNSVTPPCYVTHAGLTATASGSTIYLNATSSSTTGFMAYTTFTQTAGTAVKMGVQANPVNMTDTILNALPGTYTFRVSVADNEWGADSVTANVTVTSATQTGFYFDTAGTGTACTLAAPCPTSYINTFYASAVAGDTAYLHRNETFKVELVNNSSGSVGNPIVTKPYGTGNLPIIGGRTALTGWTNVSGNVWEVAYTGPQPNILQHNDTILTQTTYPDLVGGWDTPTSMTTTQITDATHVGQVVIGSKIMIRSSAYTIDTAIVSNVAGSVITFSPAATYSGVGGNGWKVMNITPYENGQYQDTLGQIRIYSVGTPTGTWTIPNVDTPLLSEGTNQEYDSLRFQGGNNEAIILAFQLTSGNVFSADSVTDSFDGFEFRSDGGVTVRNTVMRHFTNNGVFKTNANNYNNSFINDIVYDAGMHPGLGRPGANYSYSGIIAGDSGSIVVTCITDSTGYFGIANFGSGFRSDSNLVMNWCQTLEDGGGHYTWIASSGDTVFARQRKIINNTFINGGSSTSNLGVSLSPSTVGVYNDNWTTNILVQGNGIVNADYGIFDHGTSGLFLYNVILNSRISNITFSEVVGNPINGLVVKNNVVGYNFPSVYQMQITTPGTDLSTFGVIDSNYYLSPINISTGLYTKSSSDGGTSRNLTSWQGNTGFDLHSSYLNYAPLAFYFTTTAVSVPITGFCRDVYQNYYTTGSITLGGYLSTILQRLSLPTINSITGSQIKFH